MAMGFNLSSGGGGGGGNDSIIPILKYDARAGRLSRRDYVNGEYINVDISRTFKAVADFENVEVGFINFATGSAPDFVVARLGDTPVANPGGDYKQGCRLLVKLGKDCGGDLREMASNAKAFLKGIDALHTDYVAGLPANAGKLPVIALKDTVPVTTGEGAKKSTNYVPVFEIVSWVSRPEGLTYMPKARMSAPAVQPSNQPPSTGSTKVAPPAAVTADSEDDFG